MEVYRWEDRKFGKLEPLRFGEERDFEDLLEKDATLVLGEPLCVISRQPPLSTSKQKIDLLALDRQGNCVIIELKRGKPSRTAITQILEYAAGISQLSFTELETLAYRWCQQQGKEFSSLTALHSEFFEYEPGDIRKSAFNQKQRLVLVSEGVDARVLEVAEYLRALGLDLTYISYFSYHAPDEILVATETVLGGTLVKEEERSYGQTTQQFMTLELFIEMLQENEELSQIVHEFLEYVEMCGATLRPRIAKLRMTFGDTGGSTHTLQEERPTSELMSTATSHRSILLSAEPICPTSQSRILVSLLTSLPKPILTMRLRFLNASEILSYLHNLTPCE